MAPGSRYDPDSDCCDSCAVCEGGRRKLPPGKYDHCGYVEDRNRCCLSFNEEGCNIDEDCCTGNCTRNGYCATSD